MKWRGRRTGSAVMLACWMGALLPAADAPAQGARQPLSELLREISADRTATERLRAAEAIAGYGSVAVPQLLPLLKAPDFGVPNAAYLALARMGSDAAEAVPQLIETAARPGDPWRSTAAQTLGQIGPPAAPAVPVLIGCLGEPDEELRQDAIGALGRLGPVAATELGRLLEQGDLQRQLAACAALERAGPGGAAALPALIAVSRRAEPRLRDAAFLAMAGMGAAAVEPLLDMLQHDDGGLRRRAAMALARTGPAAAAAVGALCRALSDEEPEVRFWAAAALGEIPAEALTASQSQAVDPASRAGRAESLPDGHTPAEVGSAPPVSPKDALMRACRDADPDVRWQAVVSLERQFGAAAARQTLLQLRDDPHRAVRAWAANRLAAGAAGNAR